MPFDIEKARENFRRRESERRQRLSGLEESAKVDLARIVAMLIERYKPLRIYQWGSLLRPGSFREWSDIDIALEGLEDPLDGLRAADDASGLTSFPVDLVELDRIHPLHAETIRKEGKLLYEKT